LHREWSQNLPWKATKDAPFNKERFNWFTLDGQMWRVAIHQCGY
jgi:hypothetical protein